MMKSTVVIEGNLKAEKDTGTFGGVNMWRLYVKTTNGCWEDVQWMDVSNIQKFFKKRLPRYTEKVSREITEA
jgi:hypothetical protein